MIYLISFFIGSLAVCILCACLENDDKASFTIISVFSGAYAFLMAVILMIAGYEYTAARHKAKIINQEYDKNYTAEEIFYASDVIETIKRLDRQRMEINGNILKSGKD